MVQGNSQKGFQGVFPEGFQKASVKVGEESNFQPLNAKLENLKFDRNPSTEGPKTIPGRLQKGRKRLDRSTPEGSQKLSQRKKCMGIEISIS